MSLIIAILNCVSLILMVSLAFMLRNKPRYRRPDPGRGRLVNVSGTAVQAAGELVAKHKYRMAVRSLRRDGLSFQEAIDVVSMLRQDAPSNR